MCLHGYCRTQNSTQLPITHRKAPFVNRLHGKAGWRIDSCNCRGGSTKATVGKRAFSSSELQTKTCLDLSCHCPCRRKHTDCGVKPTIRRPTAPASSLQARCADMARFHRRVSSSRCQRYRQRHRKYHTSHHCNVCFNVCNCMCCDFVKIYRYLCVKQQRLCTYMHTAENF